MAWFVWQCRLGIFPYDRREVLPSLRLVAQFYPSKYRDEARRGEQCLKQTEDVFGPVSQEDTWTGTGR